MIKYSYITSVGGLSRVAQVFKDNAYIFLDTETANDRIRLVQLGDNEHIYILDLFDLREAGILFLKNLLSQKGIVGHNLKFDLKYLLKHGIEPYAVFDTLIASQLLGETDKHSLQHAAMHYLGEVIDKSMQLSNWGSLNLTEKQLEYAAMDVKIVRSLFYKFVDKLNDTVHIEPILLKTRTARVFNLKNPVAILEMAFVVEVAKLELSGIPIDKDELENKIKELEKTRQSLVMDFYSKYKVDPMSSKQVGDLFTRRFNLDLPKTDKGNVSTDDKYLSEYVHIPAVKSLLDIRGISKQLEKLRDIKQRILNGRVYPEFKQIGTITGRMSSLKPNVQNIPRDLRSIFKAQEGNVFVIADFSQIELRLAAEYVNEEKMIKAFKEGKDMHRYTASLLLGKPESEITHEERQLAKAVNFGLIYGISAKGLMEYAKTYGVDIDIEKAQALREGFFEYYTGFKHWHEKVKRELREHREVVGTTLLGRKYVAHTFPDAVNYPIQGSGADLLKLSVLMVNAALRAESLKANVVNLIHDEIVLECDQKEAHKVEEILKKETLKAGSILLKKVPVEVETSINQRWIK